MLRFLLLVTFVGFSAGCEDASQGPMVMDASMSDTSDAELDAGMLPDALVDAQQDVQLDATSDSSPGTDAESDTGVKEDASDAAD